MSYLLQKSSTARPLLFLMVQSADHITGLTGASPTVTISKNGAAFASPAGAVTELSGGWYAVAGNATDTATTGPLLLHATAASGDPTDVNFEVVAFNPDDGVRLGLTALPNAAAGANGGLPLSVDTSGRVDVLKVNGTPQTARDLGANLDAAVSTRMATFTLPTNFASLSIDSSGRTTVITYVGNTPQTGDGYAVVNSGSFGNSALLSAVQNVQNNTFIATSIPQMLERPDAGSKTVTVSIVFSDETGAAKNLDSGTPAIALLNDACTILSSRLGVGTNPATGKYTVAYTSSSTDPIEGLHWDITGTINGKLRRMVAYTQIVDTTAVDFTSDDRATLDALAAGVRLADGVAHGGSAATLTLASATLNNPSGPGLTVINGGGGSPAYAVYLIAADAGIGTATDSGYAIAGSLNGSVGSVTSQLTAAAIATGVWQDAVTSDFTAAGSIGLTLINGGTLGAGLVAASVAGNVGGVAASGIQPTSFAPNTGLVPLRVSSLTAGSVNSATLDGAASAVDGFYAGGVLVLTTGTGAGQARLITGYVGSTKVASVSPPWAVVPAAGANYAIVANAAANVAQIAGQTANAAGAVTFPGSIGDATDAHVLAVKARTDNLPATPAAVGDIPTANQNADAYLDRANAIETGVTPRQAERLILAGAAGKSSGFTAGAGTGVYRNAVADTKVRITVAVDGVGNRTSITWDAT